MSTWIIDIDSFIRVVSDDFPTEEEIVNYIREEISELIDNMHTEVSSA